ncbi:hypothetical protein KUTeg_019972 [Tegillarca granosa]|uniref:Uncharacterized protein n=1 Tax=Tegillarca granosa TaxID=220873 RepID=A0ABQ9EDY9_TEGGR|nr:hypothetical protein KUTeg_019972 [Tegillarca granosa]
MFQHLMEAFHCCTPAERQIKISPLLASLTTYDVYFDIADEETNDNTDKTQSIYFDVACNKKAKKQKTSEVKIEDDPHSSSLRLEEVK